MRFSIRFLISILLANLLIASAAASAAELKTSAKQVLIVDHETGAEVFAKNADEKMQPASMTKLMTAYLLFEKLKNGNLSLDDTFPVSKKAWKMQGSKMFVLVGTRVRIEDLI
jgi:D-alanyl-D-alanine carboxypeptidase (penicillin-binding protein 5/6)